MDAVYRVLFTERAKRDAKRLPPELWRRLDDALASLSHQADPRSGVKQLGGGTKIPFYSLRVGNYRAILNIFHDRMVILVLTVQPRKTIYRNY